MGYNTEHITITLRLHNHHDERDLADEVQSAALKCEIKALLDDPRVTIVSDYTNLEV